MGTLWQEIYRTASQRPEARALLWNGQVLTYADLMRASRRIAGALAERHIGPGDRVGVGLPNCPDLVAALLGVLRAGATYVPLNAKSTAREAIHIIAHAETRLAIVPAPLATSIASERPDLTERLTTSVPLAAGDAASETPRDPEAAALIIYTSGTTGRPKGAVLSHRALVSNLRTVAEAWEWEPKDRLLLTLPCSHLHGLGLGLLGSFLAGSSVVLRPRFAAGDVPADLARHRATMFFGVPTMYNRLAQLPASALEVLHPRQMRLWVSGSAPLLPASFERFRSAFGHSILERFGMTEGGFMIAAPYRGSRRPGVVGLPLPGVEIRLIDAEAADAAAVRDVPAGTAGEIAVRGPNLFSGYWQDPAATAAAFVAGYFRSGDLAIQEPDGMLRIVGRRAIDIIKTRGFKVSAVEIENRLQECPGVGEVAVIGVPHPDWGEAIVAVVAPAAEGLDPERLDQAARQSLAPHKRPSRFVFLDEIPKAGPGKFRKHELRRLISGACPDAGGEPYAGG